MKNLFTKSFKLGVLLFLLFNSGLIVIGQMSDFGEIEWKLIKTIQNIEVYHRATGTDKVKEIKIKAIANSSFDKITYHLRNPETYVNWVYNCTTSKVIKRIDENSFYYYAVTDFPFPATDRDMVVFASNWTENQGNAYRSTAFAVDQHYDNNSKLVKIPSFEASWNIDKLPNNQVQVVYTAKVNPGGDIPDWVINILVDKGPVHTMQSLLEACRN